MTAPQQLGFGFDEMLEAERTAHVPSTMEEAIPYYRGLLERHHAAMTAGDIDAAMKIRDEAQDLAVKLNGGELLGICAGPDAPAYRLERETAAPDGTVPLWGQTGNFIIDVNGMKVRIEQDGLFGIGSSMSSAPGFAAHAVDYDKPFLSETGFRSFIGSRPEIVPGMTPDVMAREMIQAYLTRECKGKPKRIEKTYVEREMERRAERAEQAEHCHD
jgi:hypothetical protein